MAMFKVPLWNTRNKAVELQDTALRPDSDFVHIDGAETIKGLKSFLAAIVFAGTSRVIGFWTGLSARWAVGVNNVAESGGNAGSNFYVERYNDVGASLGNALTISRDTGVLNTQVRPTFAGNTPWDSANITLDSGNYTPTLNNTTNVDATTPYSSQWMRVGSTVTVSGRLDVDPTAAAATVVGISLPVASNLGAIEHAVGTAVITTSPAVSGIVRGNVANDRAELAFTATGTATVGAYYQFTYRII